MKQHNKLIYFSTFSGHNEANIKKLISLIVFDFSRHKYSILKLDNYFLLKIFISICVINSISTYFLNLFSLLPHLIAMVFCWVVVIFFVGFVEDLLPCFSVLFEGIIAGPDELCCIAHPPWYTKWQKPVNKKPTKSLLNYIIKSSVTVSAISAQKRRCQCV